jgi:hypothetical protein
MKQLDGREKRNISDQNLTNVFAVKTGLTAALISGA